MPAPLERPDTGWKTIAGRSSTHVKRWRAMHPPAAYQSDRERRGRSRRRAAGPRCSTCKPCHSVRRIDIERNAASPAARPTCVHSIV